MKKKKPEAVGFLTHHPEEGCHGLPAPVLVQGEGEVRVLEEKRPNLPMDSLLKITSRYRISCVNFEFGNFSSQVVFQR